ncbi:MAG: TM2 domain-containing protein, partial [Spirochaetales bacterium]|nr:TM2 domain-containing protein [Spirochaetales bacterium]
MKKVIFLFIVMVLLPLASSAQDEKTEEWQSDLLRGDGYAQSGDADAAWLFYERSMAKGLDDGKALFRVAQAYDRQRLYGNPDFGEVLYSVAARFLQEQDPQSPEFEEALIQSGTLGVADQRILRRAYSHFGGRPPHRPFPYFTLDYWKERFSQNRMSSEPHAMDEHPQEMDDNSAMTSMDPMEASRRVLSPLRFLKQQFHVLRTGWHVWKSSGQRVFWAWLQVHWKEAMVAYTLLSALTGILLPAVLGYSVAREGRKSYVAAYLFLLHWGPLGIHRFYLGRWKTALLWLFTGGFFGLGLFLDLFLTGTYVRVWNEDHRGERNSTRSHSSPRGSSSRSLKKGQSIKKLGKPQGMSSQKESRQSKKALRQRTKQSHKSRSGKSKKKRQSEGS